MRAGASIVFIVNPASGSGETGRQWGRISAMARDCLGPFESAVTSGPGQATLLTRQFLSKGADIIVCVGGDGTLNEVVNGFMDAGGPIRRDALLGFMPNGTGCDFAKSISIPTDIGESLDTIRRGDSRVIDLGRIRYTGHDRNPVTRYFHNVASFGLGGEVVDRTSRSAKVFGPLVSFATATLVSVLRCGKKNIRLSVDGGPEKEATVWNIAVANGRFHGGGMLVAPRARLDDGLLDVTVIGDLNLGEVFYHLPKLYNGRIEEVKSVSTFTCRKVEARSDEKVLIDLDGEQPGCLPAVIDVVPRTLPVLAKL